MRRLVRSVFWLLALGALAKAAAAAVAAIIGEDRNQEGRRFRLTTLMDGTEFASRSPALAAGSALTLMGGADIDLREATLDPGGARVELTTWLGGTRLLVSEQWRVDVSEDVSGAQHQIELPPDPPADAPLLQVHLVTRAGAVVVATAEADHHVVRSDFS